MFAAPTAHHVLQAQQVAVLDAIVAWLEQVGCCLIPCSRCRSCPVPTCQVPLAPHARHVLLAALTRGHFRLRCLAAGASSGGGAAAGSRSPGPPRHPAASWHRCCSCGRCAPLCRWVGVSDAWLPGAASAGGAKVPNALPYSPCVLPTRLPFLQVTAESSCSRCWRPCCACCSARPAWLSSLRRCVEVAAEGGALVAGAGSKQLVLRVPAPSVLSIVSTEPAASACSAPLVLYLLSPVVAPHCCRPCPHCCSLPAEWAGPQGGGTAQAPQRHRCPEPA